MPDKSSECNEFFDIPVPYPQATEPAPDEMGYCLVCDVDIYLPVCRDFLCPQHSEEGRT